ncbi:MAG: SAM-dependent methyltransferase [Clostridia bacterium]|nr:SAM-dependent methyltransferase [Clostridia bacterium]
MITLSPRLKTAADMSIDAKRIIDVGCDHGYLSAYMLMARNAQFAYACDINQGPLDNAAKTAAIYDLADRMEFRLCNGLEPFCGDECDTVFICGMGGELIADILSRATWTIGKTLILQPMTRSEKLREFLSRNGYGIECERAVEDDGRLYSVMRVRGSIGDCGKNNGYLYSQNFIKDEFYYRYIGKLLQKYRDIYEAKLNSNKNVSEEQRIINILEDAYAYR